MSKHICTFCGEPASTRDHIPPKCMFPNNSRKNLITVPACRECNSATSKDDEYFRMVVASASNAGSAAAKILREKVVPGAKIKPGLVNMFRSSIHDIEVFSECGTCIGERPAYKYQASRVQPIVDKIVRGLFYKNFGEYLSRGYCVDNFGIQPDLPAEMIPMITTLPINKVVANVFEYRCYADPEDPHHSYWFLMFYEDVLCFTRTISEAEF